MNKPNKIKLCLIYTLLINNLTGCIQQDPAPIHYNHNKIYSRSGVKETGSISIQNNSDREDDADIISKEILVQENDLQVNTEYLTNSQPNVNFVLPNEYQDQQIVYHEVMFGETLDQIAKNYNTTISAILILNDIDSPSDIHESQIIKIKTTKDVINQLNQKINTDNQLKHISLIKPVNGNVVSRFGEKMPDGSINKGINISTDEGSDVVSVINGKVMHAGYDEKFGNIVIIESKQYNLAIAYAHLEENLVNVGNIVKQDEVIGYVGNTGNVNSPQLHFAIRQNNVPIDPLKLLPK
ncbi:MAG: peptidoglycan DD-metalloendopeptidase family protein [Rickettsiaceae bacterium]